MQDTIHADYGGFSPFKFSTTLRFSDPELKNHFDSLYLNLGKPGELPRDNSSLRFQMINVGTSLEHEVRHFHDFACTPFGYWAFFQSLETLTNCISCLNIVSRGKGFDDFPIPIGSVYEAIGENNQPGYKIKLPFDQWSGQYEELVSGKAYTSEEIEANYDEILAACCINTSEQKQRIAKALSFEFGVFDARLFHLFECSAFLVQHTAVHKTYGASEADEFVTGMMFDGSPYTKLFAPLVAALSRCNNGKPVNPYWISTAIFWCISAPFHPSDDTPKPVVRFFWLLKQMFESAQNNSGDIAWQLSLRPNQLLELWDKRAGMKSWKKSIQFYDSWLKEIAAQKIGETQDNVLLRQLDICDPLINYIQSFVQSASFIHTFIMDDVNAYLMPEEYFDRYHELPSPVVEFDYREHGFGHNVELLKKKGNIILGLSGENEEIATHYALIPGDNGYFDLENYKKLLFWFKLAEFLTEPDTLSTDDYEDARIAANQITGKSMFRIW